MRRKIQPLLCELHAHTRWSDGALEVGELVDLYGSRGFDVLCVTDHVIRETDPQRSGLRCIDADNHADYLAELAAEGERARREYDLLLLPGLELTYNDHDPYRAAHAVAVGCTRFVAVDAGLEPALEQARDAGAALVAAHPYRTGRSSAPARATLRFSREWRTLRPLIDRWELFNRDDLFGWVARSGLPAVACGDFHRPEHLEGWKTLLPCERSPEAVVRYLRSARPAFLTRVDDAIEARQAA
jgi:predicted metal-dependent phosphoesterase TrpH